MASRSDKPGNNVTQAGGRRATSGRGGKAANSESAQTEKLVVRRSAAKSGSAQAAAQSKAVSSKAAPEKVAEKKPAAKPARGRKTASAATSAKAPAKARAGTKAAAATAPESAKPVTAAPLQAPEVRLEKAAGDTTQQGAMAASVKTPEQALADLSFSATAPTAQKLAENVERIEALSHRLVSALSERSPLNPGVEGPGPDLLMTTASAWMKTLAEQPSRIIGQQVNYWGETLKHYASAQMALAQRSVGHSGEDDPTASRDKRFANPLWQSHPYFSFVKKQYLINADAMKRAAGDLALPDEVARRRVNWMTNQIIDMMSPTNFLATNPDALEKAVETEGESLVKGLENLVNDIEQNRGEMIVSLADRDAFTVGENIGTSEGRVVYRTSLFELIQYQPKTDQVHQIPLVIFPPWINKFYILDLKPQNSMIRWLVEQGQTLFIVSWKNPDTSYAEIGMEDYIAAYLEAMDKVRELTAQPKVNAVGYCIAGTTLSLALALLNKRGDDRVNSATFFTTLTDFSDQGEFTNFLQDDFVDGIAEEVHRYGLLRAQLMSRTMSFLRANDLVWGPAIRSYMLGETPPAFDLLFWNGDSTNLPGRMAMQYLRGLCQQNAFAGGGFELMGETLRLSDVKVPLCSVACEGDHIAPWKDCWNGVASMGAKDKTFILSESGHVAGIVNPPTKKKYGHYAGGRDFDHGNDGWRDSATYQEGSWWPRWGNWLAERSGGMVPARTPDEALDPAPGTYVHERAS